MSQEMSEDNALAATPISTKDSKKKRKHDEEKGQKSSKKRKQVLDEAAILEQEYGINPEVAQVQSPSKKDKKHKKKREDALPSPETTSPSKATSTLVATSTTEQKTPLSQPDLSSTSVATPTSASCFKTTRASLFLPLPPIAISTSTALSSLLAQHISPLLLTYHIPLQGIIISFSDPVLSSTKPTDTETTISSSETFPTPLAHCRDEHGVSFIWLTLTFLLFCPKPGDELQGYINTATDGFVGLITYNYFQVSIGKERIPSTWKWIEPNNNNPSSGTDTNPKKKKKGKTTKLNDSSPTSHQPPPETSTAQDEDPTDDTTADSSGFYTLSSTTTPPTPISGPITYRVTDTELIPSEHAGDKWSLRIMGTLLDEAEENALRDKERERWEERERRKKGLGGGQRGGGGMGRGSLMGAQRGGERDAVGGMDGEGDIVMSGGLVGEGEQEDGTQALINGGTGKKKKEKKSRRE